MSKLLYNSLYPPYYRLEVYEDGTSKVFSDSAWMGGKEKKQIVASNGYIRIAMMIDGKTSYRYLHRMVAETVYGPCPEGMQVNHKDSNRINNNPSNLEYVTHLGNIQHMNQAGRASGGSMKGSANPKYIDGRSSDTTYRAQQNRDNASRYYWANKELVLLKQKLKREAQKHG